MPGWFNGSIVPGQAQRYGERNCFLEKSFTLLIFFVDKLASAYYNETMS